MNYNIKRFFIRLSNNTKRLWEDLTFDFTSAFREVFWYFPKKVINCIVKVIQFIPLLYRDVDYDYVSLLKLMQYKIKRTRIHIKEHGHIANVDKYCAQMQEAEVLIEREINDEWAEKERKAHDKKWGRAKYVGIKVPGKPYTECRTIRLNIRNDKDKQQEHKEYVVIMNLEMQRKKDNWNRLFKILKGNMRNWWD